MKILLILAKVENEKFKNHMKTRVTLKYFVTDCFATPFFILTRPRPLQT